MGILGILKKNDLESRKFIHNLIRFTLGHYKFTLFEKHDKLVHYSS